jgi:hypothetical protein
MLDDFVAALLPPQLQRSRRVLLQLLSVVAARLLHVRRSSRAAQRLTRPWTRSIHEQRDELNRAPLSFLLLSSRKFLLRKS